MGKYRDVQPHGTIKEIFPDVFIVTGSNSILHDGLDIQVSRNMIIVREGRALSLINTVRLNDDELKKLDALGKVENVVRIGAFHGYDDAFYLDRYQAKLWGVKGMTHESGRVNDVDLVSETTMPFSHSELFSFFTTRFPEAMILLKRPEGNILVTCDSIQNWTAPDEFFNETSAKAFQEMGLIKTANIPSTWTDACQPEVPELAKIKTLAFRHLLSAHGEPLIDQAYEKVSETLNQKFNIK